MKSQEHKNTYFRNTTNEVLRTGFHTHLVSPDWARASDGLCAAPWAHYEKPCLAGLRRCESFVPPNMVSHNGLMRPHRARPTLALSRGTPGGCRNGSGALHSLYFWNMYFYVREISFYWKVRIQQNLKPEFRIRENSARIWSQNLEFARIRLEFEARI